MRTGIEAMRSTRSVVDPMSRSSRGLWPRLARTMRSALLRVAWEIAADPWTFQPPAGTGEAGETVSVWELRSKEPGGLDRTMHKSEAKLVHRSMLRAVDPLVGPMIILEQDATSYIPTNWSGNVTEDGYLRLRYHG